MSTMKRIMIILRNIGISYVITILLLMGYALLLAYTNLSEDTMPVVTFVISLISVLVSSSLTMIKIRENGLVNGGLVGLIYIMLLYLFSSIFATGFGLTGYSFSMILFHVLIGMIGGIIGVNMIKEERARR